MRTFRACPDIKAHLLRQVECIALYADSIEEPVTDLLELLGVYDFPVYLGLPRWLAEVEPLLHAGLSPAERQHWPRRFLDAIPVNLDAAELDRLVLAPFLVSVLRDTLTTFDADRAPAVRASVESVIGLWERDDLYAPAWLAASADLGRTTWQALSECPTTLKGKPLPGQEETARAFRASLMASGMVAGDDSLDPATVAVCAALEHVEPGRLGRLAGELLGLLQWLGPPERGDLMLRAVQAAG